MEPSPPDYGDSFADVYDDWYGHVTDPDATADRAAALAREAGVPRVLELGIGSGRLALPIADRGIDVVGIDSSPAMVDLLAAKSGAERIEVHRGDMTEADALVDGPFGAVLIAFNTLFNVVDPDDQTRVLTAAAQLCAPDGSVLIETAVWPDPPESRERGLSTSRVDLDRVVLSATDHDPATQVVTGQHIDITEAGTRLRPWRIRYLTLPQLDAMATDAGLELADRWGDWSGRPLAAGDPTQISRFVIAR